MKLFVYFACVITALGFGSMRVRNLNHAERTNLGKPSVVQPASAAKNILIYGPVTRCVCISK
jgi:hypothetical protein